MTRFFLLLFFSCSLLFSLPAFGQEKDHDWAKARKLFEQEKYPEVLEILNELIQKDSAKDLIAEVGHSKLYELRARTLEKSSQAMDASLAYKHAVTAARKGKDEPGGIGQISHILLQFGNFYFRYHYYNQAKEQVRQSFATLDTQQVRDLVGISEVLQEGGFVLWKSGSLSEAENWLSRALTIRKDTLTSGPVEILRAQVMLACIHTQRGKYQEAETAFDRDLPALLRVSSLNDPVYREGLYYRARLMAETGRYNAALVQLTDLLDFLKVEESNLVEVSRLTAELYARTGDFKPALDIAEKTRFRYEAVLSSYPELYVYSYASLLNLYYASGDSASAEKYYEYASMITRKSLGKDHPVYAWILGEKGIFLLKIGRFKDAIIHLNKSTQIWQEKTGVQSLEYGLALYRLGYANAYIGRFNKAQPYFLNALEVLKLQLTSEHPLYCRAMDETAELYMLVARYDEARKYLMPLPGFHQNRMAKADPDHTEIIHAYTRLGRLYTLQGDFTQADSMLRLAAQAGMGLKGYNQFYEARVLAETSRLNFSRGNYDAALQNTEESARLLLSMPFRGRYPDVFQKRNQVAYGESRMRKGLILSAQGKYYEASENLLKALDIFKAYQGEDYVPFAEALAGLARINFQLGYYTLAERQSARSKDIMNYVAGDFHPSYGESLRLHADILLALGRLEEAEKLLEQALAISRNRLGEKHPQYARQLSDLAYIHFFQGQIRDAIEGQRQALNILKARPETNPGLLSRMEIRLALVLKEEKSYPAAQVVLIQCIARLEKSGEAHRPLLGEATYLNALLLLEMENWEQAGAWLSNTYEHKKAILPVTHPDLLLIQAQMAYTEWKLNRTAQATQLFQTALGNYFDQAGKYFAGMSEMERSRFYSRIQPFIQLYADMVSEMGIQGKELVGNLLSYQLESKGILLHETALLKGSVDRSGNEDLKRTYQKWADLSGQIARFGMPESDDSPMETQDLLMLQSEINQAEKELIRKSTLAGTLLNQPKPDWKKIQSSLSPDEAAIEIIRTRSSLANPDSGHYIALVLRKDSPYPVLVNLSPAAWAEQSGLINYKRSILNKMSDPYSYSTYWKSVDSVLAGIRTVYLCPDGVYHFINPETFSTPSGGYVADRLQVLRVSNLKEIHNLDPSIRVLPLGTPDNKEAMIVGDPDFYLDRNTLTRTLPLEHLPELPHTRKEAEGIRDMLTSGNWKCTLLTGISATEQAVRNCKSPGILHLATHGYFIPETRSSASGNLPGMEGAWLARNPMLRSGLLLTGSASTLAGYNTSPDEAEDGILTALEVMNMDLAGTDLVVLSACETGLGELKAGEGLLGLQRGFRIAGAHSVLMTIWNIPDAETSEVMSYFYQNFLKGGTHAEALRTTIQQVRTKYPEPYYWGGFVLNGE